MTEPTTSVTGAGADAPAVQARPILTTQARLALRVLSDDDVARVHAAALELLGAEGAAAEAAAASAPSAFVLAGRVPEHDVALGAGHVWLAAGAATAGAAGVPERVRRITGGDSVPATAADLDEAVKLADALPEVAVLAGPPLRAAGLSATAALARCVAGTSKHVMAGLLTSTADAETAVELAAAVAGSAGEAAPPPAALALRRRGRPGRGASSSPAPACPSGWCWRRPTQPPALPLRPRRRRRRPTWRRPRAADLGPALVRHHAGVLAGCAAVQAAAPGAPFFYVADPMAAGLPPAGPQASLFQLAAAQLAAHVGLPFVAGGLRTTSHEPDWQACQQDAFVSMTTTASGADVTGGAGLLGAAAAFSPQQLVMDSEIFSWNAFIACRHRGRRRDHRPRRDQAGRHRRQLPRPAPHPAAHEGGVAPAPARPQHVGRLGRLRPRGRLREGDRAGGSTARRAHSRAARRRGPRRHRAHHRGPRPVGGALSARAAAPTAPL